MAPGAHLGHLDQLDSDGVAIYPAKCYRTDPHRCPIAHYATPDYPAKSTEHAILFIPEFLENIKYLYQLNPAMFFLFVVVPGVITTACSLIWNIGNAWEKLGDALDISKAEESLD